MDSVVPSSEVVEVEKYQFEDFEFYPKQRALFRGAQRLALTPKPIETLLVLVQQAGRTVSKEELLRQVWGGAAIEENNLTQSISALRKALGEKRGENRFIVTDAGRGYRFVAAVTAGNAAPTPKKFRYRYIQAALLALFILGAVGATLIFRSPSRSPARSLAVVPFENRTGDAAYQYLAQGLTEDLTSAFVKMPELRVIAPPSAAAAGRQHGADFRALTRQLGVAAVLTGTLERSGDKIRVTARLGNGARVLWSESYLAGPHDIASVESPILQEAARSLGVPAPRMPSSLDTTNREAHDLYIQGRYLWSARGEEIRKSIPLFERALEKDPNYALARMGLADAYGLLAVNGLAPASDALPKAEAAAARALGLAPQSAEVHASMGLIKSAEWDWNGADRELRLALKLNPGYAITYARLAREATIHGRFDEAEALLRSAQTADPLDSFLTYNLGENAYYARRYEEAIAQAAKIRTVRPTAACNLLARTFFVLGRIDEARAAAECEAQGHEGLAANLSRATLIEPPASAARRFRALLTQPLVGVEPFFIAEGAARLGQTDLALDWLEKAFASHDPDLASIRVEPVLDPIRNEPRYRELVRKIGLE